MDQSADPLPESSRDRNPDESRSSLAVEILLAEYAVARDEISKRSEAQHALLTLNVTGVSAVVGLVLAGTANSAVLLLVPFLASALGMLYLDHRLVIRDLGAHVRGTLRPWAVDLSGEERALSWEAERRKPARSRFFYLARFGPVFLIFQGATAAILVGLAVPLAQAARTSEYDWVGAVWILALVVTLSTLVPWLRILRGR